MVKKILLGLLLIIFTSCNSNSKTQSLNLKVVIPNGATAVSHLRLINNDTQLTKGNTIYELVDGADLLSAMMSSKEADIIVAPSNLGAKIIEGGANYQMAAIVTSGNLFLVCKRDINEPMLEMIPSKIITFGQNTVVDKVLDEVLRTNEINLEKEYVNSVNDVQTALITDQYQCGLLAQPALSATITKLEEQLNQTLDIIIDLQEGYQLLSGGGYPQAAIFVKTDLDKKIISNYLSMVESDVEMWNQDYTQILNGVEVNIGVPNNILALAYDQMGVVYYDAKKNQTQINQFLSLFGINLNEQDFFER